MDNQSFKKNVKAFIAFGSQQYVEASIGLHKLVAARAGISVSDYYYLNKIKMHGEYEMIEIARRTCLSLGAVTGLIKRLEEKGLVKRHVNEFDKRKFLIEVDNRKMQQLLDGAMNEVYVQKMDLMDKFTVKELLIVQRYFTGATDIMRRVSEDLKDDKRRVRKKKLRLPKLSNVV